MNANEKKPKNDLVDWEQVRLIWKKWERIPATPKVVENINSIDKLVDKVMSLTINAGHFKNAPVELENYGQGADYICSTLMAGFALGIEQGNSDNVINYSVEYAESEKEKAKHILAAACLPASSWINVQFNILTRLTASRGVEKDEFVNTFIEAIYLYQVDCYIAGLEYSKNVMSRVK